MTQRKTFISKKYRPDLPHSRPDDSHLTRFNLDYRHAFNLPEVFVNAICFGPKKDRVIINLEHVDPFDNNILFFYYEDLSKRWTYIKRNNENYFLYKKNASEQLLVKANCLYIRGCQIEPEHRLWSLLGAFFNYIDCWDGKVLCAPSQQLNNESKLYQLSMSLKKSLTKSSPVSIGNSYVVKGQDAFDRLDKNKSYVVKSLSGVRSIAVDSSEYNNWDFNNLYTIPVLFQEKINGNDIRSHVLNQKIFSKISNAKQNVDYRYDNNFFELDELPSLESTVEEYCIEVAKHENNRLLGIDFIKQSDTYYVLEANPSPGWSAYHEHTGMEKSPFISTLMSVLCDA